MFKHSKNIITIDVMHLTNKDSLTNLLGLKVLFVPSEGIRKMPKPRHGNRRGKNMPTSRQGIRIEKTPTFRQGY